MALALPLRANLSYVFTRYHSYGVMLMENQIIIHHRGGKEKVGLVEDVFRSFKSHYVYLGYEEHDMVTANTQAVTHAAFLR